MSVSETKNLLLYFERSRFVFVFLLFVVFSPSFADAVIHSLK